MKWVFLYACVAFSCGHKPAIPGDGAYYETHALCLRAAAEHRKKHHIRRTQEAICVERERS